MIEHSEGMRTSKKLLCDNLFASYYRWSGAGGF